MASPAVPAVVSPAVAPTVAPLVEPVVDRTPGAVVEVLACRWKRWLRGEVMAASDLGVLVRYQLPGRGTMVDTLLWWRVRAPRAVR